MKIKISLFIKVNYLNRSDYSFYVVVEIETEIYEAVNFNMVDEGTIFRIDTGYLYKSLGSLHPFEDLDIAHTYFVKRDPHFEPSEWWCKFKIFRERERKINKILDENIS